MATAATALPSTEDELTRVEMHEPRTLGERIADSAAEGIGSWKFIIIQTILVCIWVALNLAGVAFQWDPYPFILLNLMFSVQAAYTGPILLLASNRQAAKDRAMAQRDDAELGVILKLQEEQMAILKALHDMQANQLQLTQMVKQHVEAGANGKQA
jgi:uncharacterized membrane protein